MLVRRLRGVLVAAAIRGAAFWGLNAAFLLGMLIVGADAPAPTLRGLVDIVPASLAMAGVAGAAFAVILATSSYLAVAMLGMARRAEGVGPETHGVRPGSQVI